MGVLEELKARADRSGVFLDFDGTLSEIADTPEAAVAVSAAAEVLGGLAERYRVVAVVSGRRLSELEERLGRPARVRLFGLYGLEGGGDANASTSEMRASAAGERAVEEILPRVLEVAAGVQGSLVEPKSSNVAVHYRLAPDPDAARESLLGHLRPLARAVGLRLIEGKRVVELVPLGVPTKGDLLAREAQGLDGVMYAGDDLADLDAFEAVDALIVAGAYGVKVAVRSAETPAALVDAADLVVQGPSGLLGLLWSLTD